MKSKKYLTRSKAKSAIRNSKYTDEQRKGAKASQKYRNNKKEGIIVRRLFAGKPAHAPATIQQVHDKFVSWSDNLKRITQSVDSLDEPAILKRQEQLCRFINDSINSDIQWKMVNRIDMMNHNILDPGKPEYELSILGNPWFVVRESTVAKSSDGSVQYGLFTNRTFKEGEILGVYLGEIARDHSGESGNPLPTHQFRNLDAKNGRKDFYPLYLGLHFINDPNYYEIGGDKYLINVKFGADYLAIATRDLKKNIEIQTSYNVNKS